MVLSSRKIGLCYQVDCTQIPKGRSAYNYKVDWSHIKLQIRPWRDPALFILCTLSASFVNYIATSSVTSSSQLAIARDLRTILSGLTGVSFFALCLQFMYARAIGPDNKTHWTSGFLVSVGASIVVLIVSFLAIESSKNFRTEIAILVALTTFFSLFSATKFANLLINQEWTKIGLLVLGGAIVRLCLWQIQWFTVDINRLVLGILVSNFIILVVLIIDNKKSIYKKIGPIQFRQHLVPLGVFLGLLIILGFGSVVRRSSLGSAGGEYSDATLTARNIFFLVAIIAYTSFPSLCQHPLFSHRLARHFRLSLVLSLSMSIISAAAILSGYLLSNSFSGSFLLVLILVASWMLFSSALIPLMYFAAHNSKMGLLVFIPACLIVVGQLVSTTSKELALTFLASTIMLFFLAVIPAFARTKSIVVAMRSAINTQYPKPHDTLTIVLPSYNPGARVVNTVGEIRRDLITSGVDVQIVVVSDGSTDGSVDALNQIHESWFTHVALKENSGKGSALRTAFAGLTTKYVGFIDADGDIPVSLLPKMIDTIASNQADVVFGSKWHPDSVLAISPGRKFVSTIHHLFQASLFKIDISDTQVGIKIYNNEALQMVLPTLREKTFSLDIEIFVAMVAYGHQNFIEMPVVIQRAGGSTVSLANVIKSLVDLIRIFWRSRIGLNYEAMAYETKTNLSKRET